VESCENTRDVVVFGTNQSEKKAMLFNPRCKSWSCDYCAEILKEDWIHQAARGSSLITSEGQELQFVTLTSRGYATPNKSVYFFKENFPKLRKRIADKTNAFQHSTGHKFAYFCVPERHKSGVLHAHMIVATHVCAKSIWKRDAHETGFGYIIDIQEMITPLLAAEYVSKYLHKGIGAEVWPKGFRRVRHSQNWPIAKPRENVAWCWETMKNENIIWREKMALLDMGWTVIDKRETD
jgi:hypothetical protein